MAGIVVPIIMQRHFDFSYLTGTNTETLTLHSALPVIPYKSGVLQMRVHANSITVASAKLELFLYPTLPCKTDGREFANRSTSYEVATIAIDSTVTGAPTYLRDVISSMDAAYLLIELKATQVSTSTTIAAQLSAELLLRED